MLYKKEGMPQEDEVVLCTVTNIQPSSVFAKLDEYDKTGMIHLSEVSAGRIRNIRDFVKEGKKIVCKVLRVDKFKGHIDLSLRRINEGQRRAKMDAIKQEQRAENIIIGLAKKLKKDSNKLYEEVSSKVFEKYEYIHDFFNDIVSGKASFEKLKFDPKIAKELEAAVKEKLKPEEALIKGELSIISYDEDGLSVVKEILLKARNAEDVDVKYKGGGKYFVSVKSDNYKAAEKMLDKITGNAIKAIEKKGGKGSFQRAG